MIGMSGSPIGPEGDHDIGREVIDETACHLDKSVLRLMLQRSIAMIQADRVGDTEDSCGFTQLSSSHLTKRATRASCDITYLARLTCRE